MLRLQQEKGEADGLLKILTSKLHEMEEANFDLHSCMSLFEAETRRESELKVLEMQKRLTALESKLSFVTKDLQNAERGKLRALKEVEDLQKDKVESKRRDAQRRLLATKRRKHESFVASQAMSQSQLMVKPPPVPVVETAVQTELKLEGNDLKQENARLVAYLLTGISRDLLILLNGTVAVETGDNSKLNSEDNRTQPIQRYQSSTPTQFVQGSSENSFSDSMQPSPRSVPFSQSVFSQFAGKTSAQVHASMKSVARETDGDQSVLASERARELYDVLGNMLAGDVSAVALTPVLLKYLAAKDLEGTVICSVLRVMYSVMHHSAHFQHFLLVEPSRSDESSFSGTGLQRNTNSVEHPRITLPGLHFTTLDDYLSAQSDYASVLQNDLLQLPTPDPSSEQRQLRLKLLSALCRVMKNNLKESTVVSDSLCVLYFWVDLGLTHRPMLTPDFKPLLSSSVITAIVLDPKGLPVVKALALKLLSQLLRIPGVFSDVESETKKSFLFNRCAKMLVEEGSISRDETNNLRILQHEIVKLMLSIIASFPSDGIRFVLESTHGFSNNSDGYRSIIYYLAQLLHRETFDERTAGVGRECCVTRELLDDQFRMDLIQDSFSLLGLLSRYVDLRNELGGDDQVHTFLAVLYFLDNLTQEDGSCWRNNSIAAPASTLVAMLNLIPGQ
ncbi:hypothetical protein PHMEG_0004504 [Phytophthora megakarya]|uniref:Uncharacterized protein n=1 Tax=Phytophthora megakarya TaxID=4795 RepID=A0A225WTV0_9STRA|nr:hypothetical protein PHMEG_0004504 [Phytophthora megakarya]